MKCLYRSCGKSRLTWPGLKIYTFPVKDVERCERWIINSGNPVDIPMSKYEFKGLCQDHFIAEDFVNETKHRLINRAIPIHFKDPNGEARKREREREFSKTGSSNVSSNNVVKLRIFPRKDFQNENITCATKNNQFALQDDLISPSKHKPVIFPRKDLQNENITCLNKSDQFALRGDLLSPSENNMLYVGKKNEKRCYLKKIHKRSDVDLLPPNKRLFQWLKDLREKRAANKNNKLSYYVNVNELLTTFDASNLFDLESPWGERVFTRENSLRCYSRRKSNQSQIVKKTINTTLLTEPTQEIENKSFDSDDHYQNLEEEQKQELTSEDQFSFVDVNDEGISECQSRWLEEDDKNCIEILDIPQLKSEQFTDYTNYIENGRKNASDRSKKRRKRGRYFSSSSTSEVAKYTYIINRQHILIQTLRNKLKMCQNELKTLKKSV